MFADSIVQGAEGSFMQPVAASTPLKEKPKYRKYY